METLTWILLAIIGWVIVGSLVLSAIDNKETLEITMWKLHAVWWLRFAINMLWPIVAIRFLVVNARRRG